jgi:flagellar protein FlbT
MYISDDPRQQHDLYFAIVRDIVQAAPSAWAHIENINNHILTGDLYKALKAAKKLIEYEQELLAHATSGDQSVRTSSPADRKSA